MIDWCKTCKNKYGSLVCVNCYNQTSYSIDSQTEYPPSNYEEDKEISDLKI